MANERKVDPVLDPNQYAFVSDQTNGIIKTYVGPCKLSLTDTEQPKIFDPKTKTFESVDVYDAMQKFVIAPKGWYVILKNPPKEAGLTPIARKANDPADLLIGLKINIPGPVAFALWPGQITRLVSGHDLRTNQYLLVRVYDDKMAKDAWSQAIIKKRADNGDADQEGTSDVPKEVEHVVDEMPELVTGKLMIIQGTDVSFYIPPSGVEVVPDETGLLVREAVTLERLEYCVLLDENGNKRYVRGPAVVFPKPTELFLTDKDGERKFPAIELNEISGLYVKVIAPYTEGGREYKVGEELFITGGEQAIYFPRPEHAIIKYGDKDIHYAVAIPPGEGRYTIDRIVGTIERNMGPAMLLPDPRKTLIVRRILTPETVSLWYPGNAKALEYNQKLQQIADSIPDKDKMSNMSVDYLDQDAIENFRSPKYEMSEDEGRGLTRGMKKSLLATQMMSTGAEKSKRSHMFGDDIDRKTKYSPPRTLTLDTKFEGIPKLNVWSGYAIQVVNSSGDRRVVVGPNPVFLEYDETLSVLELSTGKPKTTDKLKKIVYLRVIGNKVSDIITAETADLCEAAIKVSYRVNFEGDPNDWFTLENPIKFLCDHVRSRLKRIIKKHTIENFYTDAIDIIRDAVLGPHRSRKKRQGLLFPENGMRVYDVEVLAVDLKDPTIATMLLDAQKKVITTTILVNQEMKNLEAAKVREGIKRDLAKESVSTQVVTEGYNRTLAEAQQETKSQRYKLDMDIVEGDHKLALEKQTKQFERESDLLAQNVRKQDELLKVHTAELGRKKEIAAFDNQRAVEQVEVLLKEWLGKADADVKRLSAIPQDLTAALQALAETGMFKSMEGLAPLAIVQGTSLVGALSQLFENTPLADTFNKLIGARERRSSRE